MSVCGPRLVSHATTLSVRMLKVLSTDFSPLLDGVTICNVMVPNATILIILGLKACLRYRLTFLHLR